MNPIDEVIYLANPYTHPESIIQQQRYETALIATSRLMENNIIVYSPVVHMHCLKFSEDIPREWDYFERFDRAMLSRCNELWILDMNGWDTSNGVMEEAKIAKNLRIPITLIGCAHLLESGEILKAPFDFTI